MNFTDLAQANASLDNMMQNMEMKEFAKQVLLDENYIRFMKSYNFLFRAQVIGCVAGAVVPTVALLLAFPGTELWLIGLCIGIFWACIWLPCSLLFPQVKIYRQFAKWFKKRGSLSDLDRIFG